MMADAIKINGLAEFSRNLKKLDNDLPKALRVALNAAADLVVQDAKPRIPRRSGRAAASVRAASTRTEARVKAGGKRAPYYPWLDFGGKVGRKKSVRRTFYSDGRYLYKSYYDNRDSGRFQEILSNALIDVAKSAGVEVE